MLALIVSQYFYRLSPDTSACCKQSLTGWSMQKKGERVLVQTYQKVVVRSPCNLLCRLKYHVQTNLDIFETKFFLVELSRGGAP